MIHILCKLGWHKPMFNAHPIPGTTQICARCEKSFVA